jgi:hypothetical protein
MTGRPWHPFDVVTHVLAERLRGCEPSDQIRALVCSGEVDWERVVGHASAQFVLPAFAAAVRDLDLAASLESELALFLEAIHGASVERNRQLCDQLAEVGGALNRVGIEPVLLKGAIRLVDGLYPDLGWRLMLDLDLLVSEAEFAAALGALERVGYASARVADPSRKDLKLRRQGLASVEVHKELFWTARKRRLLRGAEVIAAARSAALDGARVRLPSVEHQIAHLIGHSQIGHFNYIYGRIALRDRLEAAAMARWRSESIDWGAVHERFAVAGYRRPLRVFLLSLRDGGLLAPPTGRRVDALTALQQCRIALQARSPVMTRISLFIGWYVALLKMQIIERDPGSPGMLHSARKLLDGEERQRIAKIFVSGPRPW